MKIHPLAAATLFLVLVALPTWQGSAEAPGQTVSISRMLSKALVPQRRALEACGVRWEGGERRAVARFRLNFDGKVRNLRVEGVPSQSTVQKCLTASLSELRLPQRASFIVREIALPLPLVGSAPAN